MPLVAIIVGLILVLVAGVYFFLAERDDTDVMDPTSITLPFDDDDDDGRAEPDSAESDAAQVDDPATDVNVDNTETATPVTIEDSIPSTVYVDGSYDHSSTYKVPSGHDDPISVSLTVADDVVTAASIDFDPTNSTSAKWQGRFEAVYQSEVVGKPVDNISVSRLGGASLTSNAFNEAIKAIKLDAKT